jgi:beta-phosphoglucomutase
MAQNRRLHAAIFDVDGVLVDSPHERAWRDALDELMTGPWRQLASDVDYEVGSLTTPRYQHAVAGRPRLDGAAGALATVGVEHPGRERIGAYADAKQARLEYLLEHEPLTVFDDAVTLLLGFREAGLVIATASASQNARRLLSAGATTRGRSLLDLLDAEVSALDAPGKPDPAIFLEAAHRLGHVPSACLVVEDAPAGVEAAKSGGMACIAVDRSGDTAALRAKGADVVLDRLDRVPAPEVLELLTSNRNAN